MRVPVFALSLFFAAAGAVLACGSTAVTNNADDPPGGSGNGNGNGSGASNDKPSATPDSPSSPHDAGADAADSVTTDADAAPASDASTTIIDAAPEASTTTGPTAQECLEGWKTLAGACPAPVITSSYVGNGCVGTTGWFVEGKNFQLAKHNVGIADDGPQSIGANGNQRHWNIITPTLLCVTVFAGYKDTWVGKTIYVINPDGKSSNSVVVADKL